MSEASLEKERNASPDKINPIVVRLPKNNIIKIKPQSMALFFIDFFINLILVQKFHRNFIGFSITKETQAVKFQNGFFFFAKGGILNESK